MPAAVKRREIDSAIAAALTDAGYRRREGAFFLKPLGGDVNAWVSYFSQRVGTNIEISPKVGVRHERVHELIDRLKSRKPSNEPTASILLGYLLPQNDPALVWRFDGEASTDELARNLVEHLVRYGEPWMRQHASEERIIEDARADRKVNPERLPAAFFLAGRPDEASAALASLLDEMGDRTDEAALRFRQFAERFRSELLPSATGSA